MYNVNVSDNVYKNPTFMLEPIKFYITTEHNMNFYTYKIDTWFDFGALLKSIKGSLKSIIDSSHNIKLLSVMNVSEWPI